jgi:hypothetical protein
LLEDHFHALLLLGRKSQLRSEGEVIPPTSGGAKVKYPLHGRSPLFEGRRAGEGVHALAGTIGRRLLGVGRSG